LAVPRASPTQLGFKTRSAPRRNDTIDESRQWREEPHWDVREAVPILRESGVCYYYSFGNPVGIEEANYIVHSSGGSFRLFDRKRS
jgi:hypothetical protein